MLNSNAKPVSYTFEYTSADDSNRMFDYGCDFISAYFEKDFEAQMNQ